MNTGKDGAVAAVDGRLLHTGIHRENKRAVVLNNSSTKAGERLYFILWDFPLVQEVLKDKSRRAKRLNYSYLLLAEFSVRTVNYGPSFFPSIYGPSVKRAGHKSISLLHSRF